MRENRTHGSEGGDGESRFRPLSDSTKAVYLTQQVADNQAGAIMDCKMKTGAVLLALFVFLGSSSTTLFAAEAKPSWQASWENTVAAAKKEGRLNFYVGRYGSEPLLNEFRK